MSLVNLKNGEIIEINNAPFEVLESQHAKLGRGGAFLRVKIKNLKSGEKLEITFKREDEIKPAEIVLAAAQFLYQDGENFYFMRQDNFEQFSLKEKVLDKKAKFLKEGAEVEIVFFKEKPISIKLPPTLVLKVIKTEPGIKGNRESPGTKPATLETGIIIQVPLFIKEGDFIKINTGKMNYLQRIN